MRMAEATGRDVKSEELGDGWLLASFLQGAPQTIMTFSSFEEFAQYLPAV
jgi:hypothetical protein